MIQKIVLSMGILLSMNVVFAQSNGLDDEQSALLSLYHLNKDYCQFHLKQPFKNRYNLSSWEINCSTPKYPHTLISTYKYLDLNSPNSLAVWELKMIQSYGMPIDVKAYGMHGTFLWKKNKDVRVGLYFTPIKNGDLIAIYGEYVVPLTQKYYNTALIGI